MTTVEKIHALQDPEKYNVKHPLHKKWTLWYDCPDKKATSQNWDEQLKNLITIETVEDFWGYFTSDSSVQNNIWTPTQLTLGANYHFFKQGVKPAWEDPENSKGGKWNITIQRVNRNKLDDMWLNTMLALIGEMMQDGDQVTGAVVSVRKVQDRIAIWTKTTDEETCKRIGAFWKKVLAGEDGKIDKIGFIPHESQKSGGKNKDLYEL